MQAMVFNDQEKLDNEAVALPINSLMDETDERETN